MSSIPHKTCTRCKQAKPRSDFSQGKSKCKPCVAAEKRERYHGDAETRDRYKNAVYKYRDQKMSDPAFVEAERTRLREWQRTKFRTDPEWRHERATYYRARRDDAERAWRAEYERTRRKRLWRDDPAFRQRLLQSSRAGRHKRRAQKAAAGGSYTSQQWAKLCALYNHRCVGCGAAKLIEVDHIRPLSRGGSNEIWNLQPLCRFCNRSKGTKTIDYRPFPPSLLDLCD